MLFFKNGIDGNFSLKPTSFGLLIDKDVCYNHIREIVAKAASYNRFHKNRYGRFPMY